MRYAVVNRIGMVLARHDEQINAEQEAMFFHAVTHWPYSVMEEK